ncbi:MAG: hypothetical protein K8S23_15715 [Candidatus Cloacimonetes bacterium]|nr:hypothetical protein [Candidatus Cloacimonadota bacterium]
MKNKKHLLIVLLVLWGIALFSVPVYENNCLTFDGVNDYVSLENESLYDFDSNFTIEFWIKVDSWDRPWQAIITKGDDSWRIHRNNEEDNIRFTAGGVSATTTTEFTDGEWHHLVCEKHDQMLLIYVDSIFQNDVLLAENCNQNDYPVYIGENAGATNRFFDGQIDDIRFWNNSKYYNTGTSPSDFWHTPPDLSDGNLVAYFSMDDDSNPDIIINDKGTDNGNLHNGTQYTSSPTPVGPNWYSGTYDDPLTFSYAVVKIFGDMLIEDFFTIDPGVRVEFQGHYEIIIDYYVDFTAVGTEAEPIIFTIADTTGFSEINDENDTAGGWKNLWFNSRHNYQEIRTIEHCIFEYAKQTAIVLRQSSNLNISNTLFRNNYSLGQAGAISLYKNDLLNEGLTTTLDNCEFKNNRAYGVNSEDANGGAIFLNWARTNIKNCTFNGNHSGNSGGAIAAITHYLYVSSFYNNILINNSSVNGGALWIKDFNVNSFYNNTIVDNSAENGGGIYFDGNPYSLLYNNIITGNTADIGYQIYINQTNSDLSFEYNIIEGGLAAFGGAGADPYSGTYNMCWDRDPLFVGSGDHPYDISDSSPCINSGKPGSTAGDYDFAGNTRIYGDGLITCGIGELDIILNSIDIGAYEKQQDSGVIPYDYTWEENDIYLSHDLLIPDGTIFTIGEELLSFSFSPETSMNIYGSLIVNPQSSNFAFLRPNTTREKPMFSFIGPSVEDNFSSIEKCCFMDSGSAGASNVKGGIIYVNQYDNLRINNSKFVEGKAEHGGGIYIEDAVPELYNCLFYQNSSSVSGGAIYCDNANPVLANLTILENTSDASYSAIDAVNNAEPKIYSCVIWDNEADPVKTGLDVYFSDVQGGYSGSTNIDADPKLTEMQTGYTFEISASSPCLNAGMPDVSELNMPSTDLFNNPRIHAHNSPVYDRIDIGAVEYAGLMEPTNFTASDGNNNYPGYVHLTWNYVNTYQPINGFHIYRNDNLISTVYPQSYYYNDYEAIPGVFYTYRVSTYAGSEISNSSEDAGFLKPNGIITGTITTPNNNPVADISVSLTPSTGYCLDFDSGQFSTTIQNTDLYDATLETWIKTEMSDFNLFSFISFTPDSLIIINANLQIDSQGKLVYTDNTIVISQEADTLVVNDNEWHHIAVTTDMNNSVTKMFIDGILVAESNEVLDISGSVMFDCGEMEYFTGSLDDIRLWSVVRTQEQINAGKNLVISWNSEGLEGYWGMNEGNGDISFDATNNGNNINSETGSFSGYTWSSNEPGIELGGITDNWGEYSITQIPYGSFTTFTVTPHKEGHFFQPEQRLITLSESSISANNVDFTDNSLIPISGRLIFQNTLEPVREASILLNGEITIPPTFTDDSGYYVMEVEHGTDCLLSVSYHDQAFDRVWNLGEVTFPQANKNFEDVSRIGFVVEVVGGDDHYPIGAFDVNLQSASALYNTMFTATAGEWFDGKIIINNVPPLNYTVTVSANATVEPNDPFDLLENEDFINSNETNTDLRFPEEFDTVVDTVTFVWYNDLQIGVEWSSSLELQYLNTDSDSLYGFYVLPQNEWASVEIKAFEDYSFEPFNNKTYFDNFDILITDEVGTQGETEVSLVDTISYEYSFAPYLPNLLVGGNRPYQNMLEITVYEENSNHYATQTDWVITEGVRPRETTFATTSPEIPFLILHDPPGDGSFSSFKQSSSHSMAFGTSVCTNRESNDFLSVHLGADITTTMGLIFSIEHEINMTLDINMGWSQSISQKNSREQKFTFTTSEEYTTSSDSQLIGDSSDLFVGGAMNLLWGVTDEIDWDEINQEVIQDTSIMVSPNGFETIYIYSDRQIRETVIPNLEAINDTTSVALWESYLQKNEDNKENAVVNPNHPSNLSFNSGAGYTFEEESSIESSVEFEFESMVSSEFGMLIGGTVDGIGAAGGFSYKTKFTMGSSFESSEETTTKTSFTLADDDETTALNFLSDYFSLDIKKDPVYGTPVFDLVSGASSCPWEQNTVPREGVSLSANTYTASGLQEGEEAAFILQLGNTSQTEEDRRYYLTMMHATNPGGATVKINGVPLGSEMAFDIPYGENVQAIMTVEQGLFEYEYEDLTLEFYTEGDRGHPAPGGHSFDEFRSFNIYWEPPYSRVNIFSPQNNWILNATNNDTLDVVINDYDLSKPDFESIKFQYKFPYQENWITAVQIFRDELEALPTDYLLLDWDVSQLSDGIYQIRAGTTDSLQSDYYCDFVEGTIDREIPELLGAPQPADGVLSLGDEICIYFTELIDPTAINPFETSVVINSTSDTLDIDIDCFENKVTLVPLWENYWFENETLTANISGIRDLYGNELSNPISWEFYVNANPVYWNIPKIEIIKPFGESMDVTAQLINSGGQFSSWTIDNLPDWLTADVNSGTLIPLDTQSITFTISEELSFGTYLDTVFADIPALGREPLIFEISVLANPPEWATTQLNNYDYSMTITGELFMEGELSADTNDIIGAFIINENDQYECCGFAPLQLCPYFAEDTYQFYLSVHNNEVSYEDLIFRVWDASTSKEHFGITEDYDFVSGEIYGTILTPETIHVSTELIRTIECRSGWTWLSVNLNNSSSMDLDTVFVSLSPQHNDIVKNQTLYAQYTTGLGWLGSLSDVSTTEMVKLNLTDSDELQIVGLLDDVTTTPINYGNGWNWIGYLPHYSFSVNQALINITNLTTGDLVKNQTGYAQYIDGYGWFGSLYFMHAGDGFMMNTANSGSFYYPENTAITSTQSLFMASNEKGNLLPLYDITGWDIDPLDYEYSANITAVVNNNDIILNSENIVIGAFYDNECRGIAVPVEVQGQWTLFLTQYANVQNEIFNYKIYDIVEESEEALEESLLFVDNQILGDPLNPFVFHQVGGALSAPQNVGLTISNNQIELYWDAVSGANSYKIFASNDPNGTFTDVTSSGSFGGTRFQSCKKSRNNNREIVSKNQEKLDAFNKSQLTWTVPISDNMKFYFIKASSD